MYVLIVFMRPEIFVYQRPGPGGKKVGKYVALGSLAKDHWALTLRKQKYPNLPIHNPYLQRPQAGTQSIIEGAGREGEKNIPLSLFAPILVPIVVPR